MQSGSNPAQSGVPSIGSQAVSIGTGCIALVVIVSAMVAGSLGGWFTSGSASERLTAETEAKAEFIAGEVELLLRSSDLSGARRLVLGVSASGLESECRVVLSGLGTVASTDMGETLRDELPEVWSADSADPKAFAGSGNGVIQAVFSVPGRGTGLVEVGVPVWSAPADRVFVSAAGSALVGCLVLWFASTRARRWVGGLIALGSALHEFGKGDRREGVLQLGKRWGPVAESWNLMLQERVELSEKLLEQEFIQAGALNGDGAAGLNSACDAMPQGVIVFASGGRAVYANGASAMFVGRKREDIPGSMSGELFTDQAVRDAVDLASIGGQSVRESFELKMSDSSGENEAEVRLSVRSLENDGEPGALVLVEDVTQQRLADRSHSSFVAQATHELRTPLTNIRLYVEQAIDEGEGDAAARAQALNVINSESRRLERIVTDMLSVSEIESGALSIRVGDVRTDALFGDLEDDYKAQAAAKSIDISFELPPKMPVIRGDRDRLGQALHNLIGNALKYTPSGGKVTVSAEVIEGGGLSIAVEDTGIGIDPGECERIFDRFYRADDQRITHVTGTGLGLAIAREIAVLHGGDISVESQRDKGSTFLLTIPGQAAAVANAA